MQVGSPKDGDNPPSGSAAHRRGTGLPGNVAPARSLAFVVNNAAFFVSHRLPIAQSAMNQGWKVRLLTGHAGSPTMESRAIMHLVDVNVPHHRLIFRSGGVNPMLEVLGLLQMIWHLRRSRPNLVHCASPKGVLYGGIASRLASVPCLVLAVSGMGYAFTGGGGGKRPFVRWMSRTLARFAYGHKNKRVIVQNEDDARLLIGSNLVKREELLLIPGSGVALEHYIYTPIEAKELLVVLPARMLLDKGVAEFAQAARLLRARYCQWQFVLVGTADFENPSAVPTQTIEAWVNEGVVAWWGHVDDMTAVYARASIVCLPSYREGMPKALIEAAAAGCAVVTTDAIGCRDAILPGETGDLVPARDSQALADALQALMEDGKRRLRYGQAGRRLAIERFSLDAVVETTFTAYQELLENA
jgi:glycosyltransferase involved in cell wall biosynthesis